MTSSLPTPSTPTRSTSTGFGAPSLRLGPLARYRPLSRLGRGGMAEVYLASWEVAPNVSRPVVIKRLHTHLSEEPTAAQMFLDEARLACRLEHENVVRTLEAGVIDGSCCIVMEYLEGQPLHRVLRRAKEVGHLPVEVAVFIAVSMLDGLGYAHEARDYAGARLEIVHRDVSPHNILVTSDGVVKVLDFGIAKAKSHEGQTATGLVKGKVGYIAPEQALAGEVDPRTDLFATGVVLWEMLTGSRLFKGDNDAATLNLTLNGPIVGPSSRRPEVPAGLDAVLLRALAREPEQRYPSAQAMRQSLAPFMGKVNTRVLSMLMSELFAEELFEQRRVVTSCMRESESVPASGSYGQPSSTSAVMLSTKAEVEGTSSVSRAAAEMRGGQRAAVRAGLVALGLGLGLSAVFLQRWAFPSRASKASEPAAPSTPVPVPMSAPPKPVVQQAPSDASNAPSTQTPAGTVRPSRALVEPPTAAKERPTVTKAAPDPANFGLLTLDSTPWSIVSADGKTLGQTPLVGVKMRAGVHQLTLKNPELNLQTSYSVTIVAGKTFSRRIGLEK